MEKKRNNFKQSLLKWVYLDLCLNALLNYCEKKTQEQPLTYYEIERFSIYNLKKN